MAAIQFYRTTSDKLSDIAISKGNLIFAEDVRTIYLDNDDERIAYEQIMLLQNDQDRVILTDRLVTGFYFVLTTNILWRLSDGEWIQITEKPEQQIVYGTLATFPRPGRQGCLYMTDSNLYHWDADLESYVDYCQNSPEWVVER